MSLFDVEKGELLDRVFTYFGERPPTGNGWRKTRCLNQAAHPDRDPSASVNMAKGGYRCHACGLAGDGWAVMREVTGMSIKEARAALGYAAGDVPREEPTWLF